MLARGTVVGGYRIEELLGRGGMGAVFRARDVDTGRVVALKLMAAGTVPDPQRVARFRGEGRAQALLEHPHVVTVYDAGESDHGLYLAMSLIDGPPLVELIRDRRLDARRTLILLAQVADALDAAHDAGLVHRDVKPHNVLVAAGDHAFLADFGLTRADAEPSLTASGELVGTVAYLAPEVVRGGEATPASDRYAFAAMAFECLTGSVVFPRASNASVLFAHANDPPPRIGARRPELGNVLDELFEHALSKDPGERPATARELVDGIERELTRTGAVELPPPPFTGAPALGRPGELTDAVVPTAPPAPSPAPPPGRRTAVVAALAAVGGAAVVATAWIAFGRDDSAPARPVATDRPGLEYVGADLNGASARPLDCRGRPASASSPACTVAQTTLPGATVVVPHDGVIRNWQVRGARGELTLAVLRTREGGAFQVATSNTETVGSADVQSFDADVEVERGDRVGLVVTPGSAVGVRDGVAGATTDRWLPPVTVGRPPDRGPGTGFDHEVLVRVGVLAGARRGADHQVTGSAAERLPAGKVRERRTIRLADGPLDVALVEVGDAFVVDEFAGGRRIARIDVPGLRPGARIVRFAAAAWGPDQGGLDLYYIGEGSARLVQAGYVVTASGLSRFR